MHLQAHGNENYVHHTSHCYGFSLVSLPVGVKKCTSKTSYVSLEPRAKTAFSRKNNLYLTVSERDTLLYNT